MVMVKPLGTPLAVGSLDREYWVFAMQIGNLLYPAAV